MQNRVFQPDRVRQRLQQLGARPLMRWHRGADFAEHPLLASAVLMPLSEHDGEFSMLFTQRSDNLRNHPGEISFPGGRRDPEDASLLQTALREAHEEVALQPDDVRVYGALTHMPTITGFEVTAFVGEFPDPYRLTINPAEIDLTFRAPLSALADPAIHHVEEREWQGARYPLHFYDFDGHIIWGATGFLLHTFLKYLEADP